MKRLIVYFAVIALGTLMHYSCGDDPSAPAQNQKECILGTDELSFGSVCVGDSTERSFSVIAPSSNDKAVSGEIFGTCDDFIIVSGGGPFSIAPGEYWSVTVRYKPSLADSDTCIMHTGAACGDVLCTATAVNCAQCVIEPEALDLGEICIGASVRDSFTMTADAGNTKQVLGVVSASCPDYTILSGDGSYALNPGETRTVVLQFAPSTPETLRCSIDLGTGCGTVECTGVGVNERAYFALKPTSATTFDWESNYLLTPPAVNLYGVTFEDPPWNDCAAGWRLDGSQSAEAGFELQEFLVPEGASSITASLDLDCEDVCVRLVWRHDTGEFHASNPTETCWHKIMFFPISPGVQDMFLGTEDGPSACESDAVIQGWFGGWIKFTFNGPCDVSDKVYSGQGKVVNTVKTHIE